MNVQDELIYKCGEQLPGEVRCSNKIVKDKLHKGLSRLNEVH